MGIRAIILSLAALVPLPAGAEVRMRLFWNTQVRSLQAGAVQYDLSKIGAGVVSLPAGTVVRTGQSSVTLSGPATLRAGKDSLELIVHLPEEEYVAQALAGEMGGATEPEALKAMAVAARSFNRAAGARHAVEGFDVCDTTHCQDARSPVPPHIRAAVTATAGIVVLHDGHVARTHYHADCGGTTEAASSVWPFSGKPYLNPRDDAGYHADAKTEWHAVLALAQIAKVLGLANIHTLVIGQRTSTGRASTLLADGRPVSAETLHQAVGRLIGWNILRSKYYDIEESGNRVIFSGRGAGHGVGFCQRGAMARARDGQDYQTILAAYYPNTTLSAVTDTGAWTRRSTERVELWSSGGSPSLGAALDRALSDAENRAGWRLNSRPNVRVFPTVAAYRDATGEPGFVAASTRGGVVRLQPEVVLRSSGRLDSTLRHEFLHLLLGARAKAPVPAWFEEGLVLCLQQPGGSLNRWSDADLKLVDHARSEAELRRGYEAARARVAVMLNKNGWETVMGWLDHGLPAD